MTVLIVDPDYSRASQYATELERFKIQAAIVPNSNAAILHCRNQEIDFLLCRAILDELTGYEVLSEISISLSRALMISAYSRELIRSVRGFDNNVSILLEPFTPQDVAKHIARMLGLDTARSFEANL